MAKKALMIVLVMIFAWSAQAQAQKPEKKSEKKPAAALSAPREMMDMGGHWTSMSDESKTTFLEGMLTAYRTVCMNSVTSLDSKTADVQDVNKRFMECLAALFPYQPSQVKETMTSLYQDKDNAKIPFDDIYYLALLKIKGDPIDDKLKSLRQKMEILTHQAQ